MIQCGKEHGRCKKGTNCKNGICIIRQDVRPVSPKQDVRPVSPKQDVRPINNIQCGKEHGRCKKGTTCKRGICGPTTIARQLSKKQTQKHQSSNQSNTKAKNVIGRFMQRTKHARKANFLNTICSDSGMCIAFGIQGDEIKKLFNGFTKFDYVDSFIRVGSESANGHVSSIKYTHRGYSANALLKSSSSPRSDNLMYEYIIGLQINAMFNNRFPIFVETYEMYYTYKSDGDWRNVRDNHGGNQSTRLLKDGLIPHKQVDYKLSCENSKYLSILIQHIDKAESIRTLCENSLPFIQSELLNSLYQIYFTLSAIKNQFTHHDLHGHNVLIYTPDETKYIQYHFHTNMGEIITFNSRHMVKIIDYGQSYVYETSERIKADVCKEKSCEPKCGDQYGYIYNKRHMTEDLILFHDLIPDLKRDANRQPGSVEDVLFNELNHKAIASTHEIVESRFPRIGNVSDAEQVLKRMLKMPIFKTHNQTYSSAFTKMGDLHVYTDRNMDYKMNF
jgi:hypothetical protein